MRLIYRPVTTRFVGGVCAGIADRFGMDPWIVRLVVVAALVTSPLLLLFYLLFWLALPGEVGSMAYLQLSNDEIHGADRFSQLTRSLLDRSGLKGRAGRRVSQTVAFTLLALAFLLQLPKVEGQNFYYIHPLLAALFSYATRFAAVLFYFSVGLAFLLKHEPSSSVVLRLPQDDNILLDAGPFREIGGLMSGLARSIRLQPVILRVLFVFLNIMTFGVAGLIYLLLVWLLRREGRGRTIEDIEPRTSAGEGEDRPLFSRAVSVILAVLFLVLAATRLVTELRMFFFNEPFFQGIALTIAGALGAAAAFRHRTMRSRENLWLLIGCAVMLVGIYELSTTLFNVQLSLPARFVVTYLVLALAFVYLALVSLRHNGQRVALGLAALLLLSAAIVQFNLAPSRFLLALVEFYDFFFPILFAGFGLWLVMER